MLYVARGVAPAAQQRRHLPQPRRQPERGNTGFHVLGVDSWLGIPVAGLDHGRSSRRSPIVVTTRTPFGRRVYAVGGNERAAVLSGIRVSRVKIARLHDLRRLRRAGRPAAHRPSSARPTPTPATTFELNAIAAAVLGGTALSGGRGTIVGTVIGAFVIGFLADGLVLVGVSTFWQTVVKGAVIILAVVIDQAQQRLQRRRAQRHR